MKDRLWLAEVSGRLSGLLTEAFTGIQFDVVPLVACDVATLDVSWTDGPSLHDVDTLALQFVLRIQLESWDAPHRLHIDRISKRRNISPAVEEELLTRLCADLETKMTELDMERLYSLPSILGSLRHCPEAGTVPEYLDLLFEATSFHARPAAVDASGLRTLRCRCVLCGLAAA
ncbi:hypothetical protein [Arthrobacter sp. Z1-15]